MFNILNGGKHADNTVDFQEFMVQPWGFDTFEGLRCGVEIYHHLKKVLKEAGLSTAVGRGGLCPQLAKAEDALELIAKATESWVQLGEQVFIALDPATSEMVGEAKKQAKGLLLLQEDPSRVASTDEMIDLWRAGVSVAHSID